MNEPQGRCRLILESHTIGVSPFPLGLHHRSRSLHAELAKPRPCLSIARHVLELRSSSSTSSVMHASLSAYRLSFIVPSPIPIRACTVTSSSRRFAAHLKFHSAFAASYVTYGFSVLFNLILAIVPVSSGFTVSFRTPETPFAVLLLAC